jgi:rare lipoprotein A (peptidoglycan hydrolase)
MFKSALAACASLCLMLPAAAQSPANFLAGVRSIHVVMQRVETCTASQYGVGDGYDGRRTASGERFDAHALTAAHRSRAFGEFVTVTNLVNGRRVRVRITDRGPFVRGRCIDLSRAAASAIDMAGTTRVTVR